MRKFSASTLVFILSTTCSAETIELKVKLEAMKEDIKSSGNMSLSLPEFEAFKANGAGIYHEQSLPKNFKAQLAAAIYSKSENGKLLKDSLNRLSTPTGAEFELDVKDYDFVFIEYWADWCVVCNQQMKQVKEFISEHKKSKILWLKVEKDPTKIEGFNPEN